MSSLESIKAPIKEEMKIFESNFKASMHSHVGLLNLLTNYLLHSKGKQMRPIFVFLTAKLNGGITPASYTAASLIELSHTASLIHDDVVDESYERRGFFSINALWKSKISVLMGDYLLAKGLLIAVENKGYDLLEIVSEAVKEMSEGELLQIQRSRSFNTTKEDYFEIIRMKTAALIAACTAAGAKSAGCDPETVRKMKEFGQFIGIAFQIKDDLFDYQTKSLTGKPAGNDIKNKKLTLPLIYSLEKATSSEKKAILHAINRYKKDTAIIKDIIHFVESKGGVDFAIQSMYEYRDKAIHMLNHYPESEAKTSLIALLNYTIERKN